MRLRRIYDPPLADHCGFDKSAVSLADLSNPYGSTPKVRYVQCPFGLEPFGCELRVERLTAERLGVLLAD